MSSEPLPDANSGAQAAATPAASSDERTLATALMPVMAEACEMRLGPVSWFKADWQRGGAATGTSTYRTEDGAEAPVVLKLPVVRRELIWMNRLQDATDPQPVVPRVYASGDAIGGYDLAWIVMERFAHGPLGLHWHENHVERVAEAAARFHAAAARFPVDQPPREEPWDDLLTEAAGNVRVNRLPAANRWTAGIKGVRQRLDAVLEIWESRDAGQWLHGDLHLANAMSREAIDAGAVSLIDLAEVRAGHWLEDAVYLERQLWARPARMKKANPVRAIAAARRRFGLSVEEDYPRLAMVRRLLLAATAPRFIRSEGHPKHLEACLTWLERGLAEL